MGWEKGKKRGPSPLTGKRVLDVPPEWVDGVLADNTTPPEDRFVAVMDRLLHAMADSSNAATSRIGMRLRSFWDNDMAKTVIWTPIGGDNLEARLAAPPGAEVVDD